MRATRKDGEQLGVIRKGQEAMESDGLTGERGERE